MLLRSRICLATLAAAALTSGCAMPGSKGSSLADQIEGTKSVRTASYQEVATDDAPPKESSDPISLKLRYARWMEEIENYNEAQVHYKVVLQQRPQDIYAILGLARIDQVAGRTAEAEAGFRQALSLQPQSPVTQHALGQFYASQKRWQESLKLLNDAMMTDPSNKAYRYQLAVALAQSGDVAAAYPHFRQSVGEVAAHFNVGVILREQGQYRQAEQRFLQALTIEPSFEAAKQAVSQVRQQAQASESYASQRRPATPVQQTGHSGHSTPRRLNQAPQQQLKNQRAMPRR